MSGRKRQIGATDENHPLRGMTSATAHTSKASGAATGEGLSIRPQILQLTPLYRRLRDSILRPHLRLTESRYFWERWKPRLGPDATVLIMEVRDRCNRALSTGGTLAAEGEDSTFSGSATGLLDALPAEGCTVSANELAAACGFSRVTLWRLLQREDVRQFVQVEHNYVYDQRLGKKRRTVSTYHVLMEDPLVEADEPRLKQLLEASVLAETPTFHFEQKVVDNSPPTLHSETTKSGSKTKRQNVQKTIVKERLGDDEKTNVAPLPLSAQRAPSRTPLPLVGHGTSSPRGGDPTALGALLAQQPLLAQAVSQSQHHTQPTAHPDTQTATPRTASTREELPLANQEPRQRVGYETNQRSRAVEAVPEVDVWRKFPEFAHYLEEVENLLGDRHSRGFYINALKRLYPGHMDIWQRALMLAREQQNIRRSRGALFTRLLRTFAEEAGVEV